MTPELREHAEVLALAIERGFIPSDGAVAWACELVVREEKPSAELVDLAGAIRPHPLDVVGLLRRLPGEADPLRVFRKVLGIARELLRTQPDALPRITRGLELMAIEGRAPAPLAGPCYAFDDERLLAEQGSYGTVEEVRAELLAFLETEALPTRN